MVKVKIIVLNWNQPKYTIDTVKSLLSINRRHFDFHIYLVDNGSTDDSFAAFASQYASNPKITLLETNQNLGYVGGNNYALVHSSPNYDYALLCNNDIHVHPDFLTHLVHAASAAIKPSIVGPKIYFAKGFEYHRDRYRPSDLGRVIWSAGGKMDWQNLIGGNIGIDEVDRGQYDQASSGVDFIVGCCFLIPKFIIDKIGLLDDSYFMYLEDADYCQRAKSAGFGLIYYPKSVIWHLNSGSSSAGSALHDYFLTRNRLIFGYKYASLRTKLALARQSLKILFTSPSSWQKQAVKDFYLKNLGKGSWAKKT